jgi:uncharacterized protein YodC (DUF2158 family)
MSDHIKTGDLVQLKSGGPTMTAYRLSPYTIVCDWFDDTNTKRKIEVHPDQLKVVQSKLAKT